MASSRYKLLLKEVIGRLLDCSLESSIREVTQIHTQWRYVLAHDLTITNSLHDYFYYGIQVIKY